MTLDDTVDYVILQTVTGGVCMNLLKLQKLVYYAQAWNLAIKNRPLFTGRFQAWVHGPVSRELYDRFAATKSLYSPVLESDVRVGFDPNSVNPEDRAHINVVLEVYAEFSGSQLEEMTHQEDPWMAARIGFEPGQRCENEIDEDLMREYYAKRLLA